MHTIDVSGVLLRQVIHMSTKCAQGVYKVYLITCSSDVKFGV